MRGNPRRVIDQARAAALAVGEAQNVSRHPLVDRLAGRHPQPGEKALAREHAPLRGADRLGRITELVLQQMPQVFVGGDPKQQIPVLELDGELKISDVGAAIAAAQPVLLLGEVIVTNAGTVQFAQNRLGGAKIGAVTVWFGKMQRNALDPAAHQDALPGKTEQRGHAERSRGRERPVLTAK